MHRAPLLLVVAVCAAVISSNAIAQIVMVTRAQVPDVSTILQHGGTAALIAFMFWLLMDERKRNREDSIERVKMLKETLEAVSKMTAAVTDSSKVLERLAAVVTESGRALERMSALVERLLNEGRPR